MNWKQKKHLTKEIFLFFHKNETKKSGKDFNNLIKSEILFLDNLLFFTIWFKYDDTINKALKNSSSVLSFFFFPVCVFLIFSNFNLKEIKSFEKSSSNIPFPHNKTTTTVFHVKTKQNKTKNNLQTNIFLKKKAIKNVLRSWLRQSLLRCSTHLL